MKRYCSMLHLCLLQLIPAILESNLAATSKTASSMVLLHSEQTAKAAQCDSACRAWLERSVESYERSRLNFNLVIRCPLSGPEPIGPAILYEFTLWG